MHRPSWYADERREVRALMYDKYGDIPHEGTFLETGYSKLIERVVITPAAQGPAPCASSARRDFRRS
jgi:hypothetical protein